VTTASSTTLPAIRALLASAIDYAGLFPPAEVSMDVALGNFIAYRAGENAWALGKLVVPLDRFGQLEAALERLSIPWPRISVSALIGSGNPEELDAIERFNQRHGSSGARVDAVEFKAANPAAAAAVLAAMPPRLSCYVELALGDLMAETLGVIASAGAFAKVRTGGTTPAAFPKPERLAEFLEAAAERKVPFKATAGLHHPVRGRYRLTYAEAAPAGTMYGYLNLLLAAAVLWGGGLPGQAMTVLLESDPSTFWINGDAIVCREQRFPTGALVDLRKRFVHGFGSCSFAEPIEELTLRSTP
jgi:hypothetical protein